MMTLERERDHMFFLFNAMQPSIHPSYLSFLQVGWHICSPLFFLMEPNEIKLNFSSISLPSTRWWSKETVAIVTGANKGIGFSFVKLLAELGLTVILTARDTTRGLEAVESLKNLGLHHVSFFRLDVSDFDSIQTFVSWFGTKFGTLDILVNNAAVSFNDLYENSVEHAETVMKTNYYGSKFLTEALLPMFRRGSPSKSRILNISSRLGSINWVKNPNIKAMLLNENLSEEHVENMVRLFLENVKSGTWETQGWPKLWTDYAVSKVALNAYSRVLAKRYDDLSVNCYCPGFTQTSMTGGQGTHSADAAASVGVAIGLLPVEELPTGTFYLLHIPTKKPKL